MSSFLLPARTVARRSLFSSFASPSTSSLSLRHYSERDDIKELVSKIQSDPHLANSPANLPPKPEPSLPPVSRFPDLNPVDPAAAESSSSSSASDFPAPHAPSVEAARLLEERRAQLYGKTADPVVKADASQSKTRLPNPPEPEGATTPYVGAALPQRSDPTLDFFVNLVMKDGKKMKATLVLHKTLQQIGYMTDSPPIPIFKAAILAASPYARIRSSRKGAKTSFMPMPLTERQRVRQGIKWIIECQDKRPQMSIDKRIATECISILAGDSPVLKKLDDRHKAAMVARSGLPRALGPMMEQDK